MSRLNSITILFTSLVALGVALTIVSCNRAAPPFDVEKSRKLAGALRDNKLYHSAIEEYEKVLVYGTLDDRQRGNLNFLIAEVYYNDLHDFENGAAYYVRAKEYDPDGPYSEDAGKNLVACLEKMGHVVDAKRELGAEANLVSQAKAPGDVEVARIGSTPIWQSAIDRQIQSLPPQVQKELLSVEARRQFVHQYVGMELMYRAALREGYDRDPAVKERQEQAVRELLIQKYLVDKVMPEVKIDSLDVRNFYTANKAGRYKGKPFDSVKAEVFLDYQNEKAGAAYSAYIQRLADQESVQFLDQNVK